ncbi:DUF4870 domain-containing protein [Rugosimonospora africana]|nr:DUF4870 domain-containing protein [Rugosimonospora africana]
MTEPPSSTGDPNPVVDPGATGGGPAREADPPTGFIPPQPPPGYPRDDVPPGSPASGGPTSGGPTQDGYTQGGYTQGGYTPQGGPTSGGPTPGGYAPGGYPPGGGYGAGGYPPPGYLPPPGPPPLGYASADDKTWALIAHFGGAALVFITAFFGWVAPLIALTTKGNQSPTVRAHAVAALNFQLTWTIVAAVGAITVCFLIGWVILPAAWLIGVIFGIIGGVRANEGQLYRYPLSFPLVK